MDLHILSIEACSCDLPSRNPRHKSQPGFTCKYSRAMFIGRCSAKKVVFRNLFHFKNYFESNFDYLNCDQGVNEDTVWFKGVKNVDTDISAVKGYQCSLVDLTGRKKCECAPKSPKGDHPRIARASIRFQ